jgi:hypothetical protein
VNAIFSFDPKVSEEIANDRAAMDADIAAGRVFYCTGNSPHKGGCWQFLQEFARITNSVVKVRKPKTLRLLMTYDEEKPEARS